MTARRSELFHATVLGLLLLLCLSPDAASQNEIPRVGDDSGRGSGTDDSETASGSDIAEVLNRALGALDRHDGVDESSPTSQEADTTVQSRQIPTLSAINPTFDVIPAEVYDDYIGLLRETYATQAAERRYRVDTFEWQLLAGKVVFAVVLLIVLAGLVLSCKQVAQGWKAPPLPQAKTEQGKGTEQGAGKGAGSDHEAEVEAGAPAPDHELEIGGLGMSFKITSPALGVVILVVSLAFFYLYLAYVFPISVV